MEITPKANRVRSIGVQFQLGEGVTVVSISPCEKSLPHGQVLEEFFVQPDVVEVARYPLGQVYYALQKCSPRDNCLACELQSTNK